MRDRVDARLVLLSFFKMPWHAVHKQEQGLDVALTCSVRGLVYFVTRKLPMFWKYATKELSAKSVRNPANSGVTRWESPTQQGSRLE